MPSFTAREVAGHSSEDSLWVIIDSYVYDVTAFHSMHPGGSQLLLKHGGQDASQPAQMAHGNSRKAKSLMGQYCIGTLAPSTPGSTRKVVALEDMGLPVDPPVTGGTQPRRGLVALDDLGDDDGPEALPTPVPTAARKVVALEDLGEGRSGPVALENLGGPAKQVVPLEELGDSRKVVTLESLGNVDSEAPPPAVKRSMRRRATKETKELTEEKVPQEKTEHEQLIEQLEEDELEDEVKEHVRILLSSWALANKQEQEAVMKTEGEEEDEDDWPLTTMQIEEKKKSRWARMKGGMKVPKMHLASFEGWKRGSGEKKTVEEAGTVEEATEETVQALLGSKVPSTYAEMFEFNATVMGFGKHKWLPEVNRCFDDLVKNSMKLSRLQEECEVLALRICKVVDGEVTLSMYKSAMLAALRSMLPKTWDPTHETAWNWLWDICDANLRQILYKPRVWQPALLNLMSRFTDEEKEAMRDEVYVRFFQAAPQGQDYFKQSNTRLHFIATRAMDMTSELLADPWEMTEQISALGLRHVGYGIPTFLIDPFANCFVEVLSENAPGEDLAIEAFQWSIGVVAKILIRVIQEGSTIVMKAINANSALQLRKAVALAPRSERAQWLLRIQVGTQKISPLSWAIQSGSLEATGSDPPMGRGSRYYYGLDALFQAHPDIVERLCADAQQLLGTLLDGLIWRSKRAINGARRVNSYVKHMVVRDGKFAGALNAICLSQDVKIISHPVVVLISDTLWAGVVRRQFILSKVSFLFSLLVFMLSEAILPKTDSGDELNMRIAVFTGRLINYCFSMARLMVFHGRRFYKAYTTGSTTKGRCCRTPEYLKDEDARLGFFLMFLLMAMCATEPMFYCAHEIPATGPSERCDNAKPVMQIYIIFSMAAMVLHWLLVINLSVFATKLAAFVLVIREVLSEVGKFMVAIMFILITFSSAIATLRHDVKELSTLPKAANCLFATTVGIYEGDYREMLHQPALLAPVFLFITVSAILLINLLIAQLNCSYDYVYGDMLGFARLARASLIVDAMVACPPARFTKFVSSLRFDQLLEFDEGDVGLGGGIQIREPANLNPTSEDIIQRFGGTSSPQMQWPEDELEQDRFARINSLLAQLKKGGSRSAQGSRFEQSGASGVGTSGLGESVIKDDESGSQ
ncbi:unnamed protein product [Effrenium voratum]|uniref:Cytochrome b5 heme-binding domain-containing protein n=1 Tax=Effrenium voratum TaxID=2562239 RepID=A0AA36I439_9DINO|nr:unnamed protein product [Effrenium voratum]